MPSVRSMEDGRWALQICNACRYCEGYCPVFPAMERKTVFHDSDLRYLANLCHNCRACYYSCQFAPPHEFALNLPKTFAEVRNESYKYYVWPRPLARLFDRNSSVVRVTIAASFTAVISATAYFVPPDIMFRRHSGAGSFYAVIPLSAMNAIAALTLGFSLIAILIGFVRFWREVWDAHPSVSRREAFLRAASNILTLKNLDGGGYGCNTSNEEWSNAYRWYHHFLFYGLLLCFASTSIAAIYHHFMHWKAPYPFLSAPVVLGTCGGIGMVIGCGGLLSLKIASDPTPAAKTLRGCDVALILVLALTALSGLLLEILRFTAFMGLLLAIHLGFILGLFLILPYSKFVHAVYRSAAILQFWVDESSKGSISRTDRTSKRPLGQENS